MFAAPGNAIELSANVSIALQLLFFVAGSTATAYYPGCSSRSHSGHFDGANSPIRLIGI